MAGIMLRVELHCFQSRLGLPCGTPMAEVSNRVTKRSRWMSGQLGGTSPVGVSVHAGERNGKGWRAVSGIEIPASHRLHELSVEDPARWQTAMQRAHRMVCRRPGLESIERASFMKLEFASGTSCVRAVHLTCSPSGCDEPMVACAIDRSCGMRRARA